MTFSAVAVLAQSSVPFEGPAYSDPRVGATRVALRRDQVKLLPRFRHHTEGEEVDRSAVLNEFAIVEESHGLVPRLFKEETSSEVSCAYLASIISELGLFNGGERAVA